VLAEERQHSLVERIRLFGRDRAVSAARNAFAVLHRTGHYPGFLNALIVYIRNDELRALMARIRG